jgi:hypothetical protein
LAVAWFEKGFEVGKNQQAYVHNYVVALRKNDMSRKANIILEQGIKKFPNSDALLALKE